MGFDGQSVTTTRSHGGAKDQDAPQLKSLALGKSIITPTALAGTNGADAKLIHGDRWQQIVGNETDFIVQNYMRTIDGNENRLLLGDLETTMMSKTKDDRFGLYLQNFFSQNTFNYFHQRIENHTAGEQEQQPTNHSEVINEEEKKKSWSFEGTQHKQEAVGLALGAALIKAEVLGAGAEGFGGKVGMGGIEATGLGWRQKAEALESRLDAFAAKITGAEVEAGGPDSSIRPVFVGILVAVHIDSPFA